MAAKLIGATMAGVFVPIVVEFAAKGADIPGVPLKVSGVVGIVVGAVPIVGVWSKMGPFRGMSEYNRDAVLAFGAASLATGIAIIILDAVRKSNVGYNFANVALTGPASLHEGSLTAPVGQIIKEI